MIGSSRTESVILLHGLGANRLLMSRLARSLQTAGYQVANWGYRSTRRSIEAHSEAFRERMSAYADRQQNAPLHVVTHSMGGIVARRALVSGRPDALRRIVMLSPPNAGSHVARRLAGPLGWWCPPLRELSDDPGSYVNRLPPPRDLEIGVIAAAGDLVVSLASTRLASQRDHIVLPGMHGLLPWRRDTADQVICFLRHGRFDTESVDQVE